MTVYIKRKKVVETRLSTNSALFLDYKKQNPAAGWVFSFWLSLN